jgi:hypothetical protein
MVPNRYMPSPPSSPRTLEDTQEAYDWTYFNNSSELYASERHLEGVRATRTIISQSPRLAVLTEYGGKIILISTYVKPRSRYLIDLNTSYMIKGSEHPVTSAIAQKCNDSLWRADINCQLRTLTGTTARSVCTGAIHQEERVYLVALRTIIQGEELCINYGLDYWKAGSKTNFPPQAVGHLILKAMQENGFVHCTISQAELHRLNQRTPSRGQRAGIYLGAQHADSGWIIIQETNISPIQGNQPRQLVEIARIEATSVRPRRSNNRLPLWRPNVLIHLNEQDPQKTWRESLQNGNLEIRYGHDWLHQRYCAPLSGTESPIETIELVESLPQPESPPGITMISSGHISGAQSSSRPKTSALLSVKSSQEPAVVVPPIPGTQPMDTSADSSYSLDDYSRDTTEEIVLPPEGQFSELPAISSRKSYDLPMNLPVDSEGALDNQSMTKFVQGRHSSGSHPRGTYANNTTTTL